MIKISTKSRYGIRALIDMGILLGEGKKTVVLKLIAERQGISKKYLDTIFNSLKVGGIVKSTRGISGGYQFAKDPSQITVLDIISILEGEPALVECTTNPDICQRAKYCSANRLWNELTEHIKKELKRKTLKELIEDAKKVEEHYRKETLSTNNK